MNTAKAVRRVIDEKPEGVPFPVRELLPLGPRAAVDQVLYRMVNEGKLLRVARGIYARPKWNKYVKAPVMPEPYVIAEVITKSRGAKLGPTGAEAAHRLGLTTQMPMQPVYVTTGSAGFIKIGGNTIRLLHVTPQKMQFAGTTVGTAIAALRYLGKEQVTEKVIRRLEHVLTPDDFRTLRQATHALPAWMMDKFYEYELGHGR